MTSIAKVLRAADDIVAERDDLKAQLKLADQTCTELMRMVDSLAAERDEWRARYEAAK